MSGSFHRLNKQVGLAVLKKYDNKCTVCESVENLCIHHIIPMSPDDESYNDAGNLTVLCRSCHMSHHRRNGDINPPSHLPPPGNRYGRRGCKERIMCKIDGCDKYQHGRSLCKKHYEYRRRKGLLLLVSLKPT